MPYVAVSTLSHDGLVRDHNEDSLAVGPWTTCATTTLTPQTLIFPIDSSLVVAVADGLGGHPCGDLASTIVVQELSRLSNWLTDDASVRSALDDCNSAVYDAAYRDSTRVGMGTTVAGVVLARGKVVVFNVGDSRVYSHGEQGLARLSVDDSPPLAPGETTTSIVTQTMGGNVDHTPINPHITTLPWEPTGRYLVCSDGLTDAIEEQAIASLLGKYHGLEAAVELWRAAMQAGGPDNITLAVIEGADAGSDD
ncbi:MAG: serine/threonine-protein phosphatase [Nocardioidaceae bacterium]|nr:serine/threonine-protein phosphatase [Nocardioidaceae bacterium]